MGSKTPVHPNDHVNMPSQVVQRHLSHGHAHRLPPRRWPAASCPPWSTCYAALKAKSAQFEHIVIA